MKKDWPDIIKEVGFDFHWNEQKVWALAADMQYPIDVMENKGRLLILDGLHRLMKAHLKSQRKVKVRIIPQERIPDIAP